MPRRAAETPVRAYEKGKSRKSYAMGRAGSLDRSRWKGKKQGIICHGEGWGLRQRQMKREKAGNHMPCGGMEAQAEADETGKSRESYAIGRTGGWGRGRWNGKSRELYAMESGWGSGHGVWMDKNQEIICHAEDRKHQPRQMKRKKEGNHMPA